MIPSVALAAICLLWLSPIASSDHSDADAVVLSHDAFWTLHPDGAITEEHHRRVRILTDRAYRTHADPRIRFWNDVDNVEILVARVTQAGGTVVETPDYGRNLVSPGGYSGWPAFAEAREWVISMSGLEPQAVAELHWRKTTRAGALHWLAADLRLSEDDPVESRSVTVTVPESNKLSYVLTGFAKPPAIPERPKGLNTATYTWTFRDLPADPDEPQAPPWRVRSRRLAFTTCRDEKTFVSTLLEAIERAASDPTAGSFKAVVDAATKDALDPPARLRGLQKTLKESFNTLDQTEAWERLTCRPAPEVLRASYGNLLEAGALNVALLQAAGFQAEPAILVDTLIWTPEVASSTAIVGVAARVKLSDDTVWVLPGKGIISGRNFPRHVALDASGGRAPISGSAAGATSDSEPEAGHLSITGRLTINAEGTLAGELKLRLTGHTYDPEQLRTADDQKSFLNGLAGKVIEGLSVESFSIATLSDDELAATASVKASKPLAAVGDHRRLSLPADFPFLGSTPLPLANIRRSLPVELVAPVSETVDLKLELPKGWRMVVGPSDLQSDCAGAGRVELKISGSSSEKAGKQPTLIQLHRSVHIARRTMPPEHFVPLREALNLLRADSSRTLLLGK